MVLHVKLPPSFECTASLHLANRLKELADKVSSVFVPAVLLMSLATFAPWQQLKGFTVEVLRLRTAADRLLCSWQTMPKDLQSVASSQPEASEAVKLC